MNDFKLSDDDRAFRDSVASCDFPIPDFDHAAHIRLAYVYLVEDQHTDSAIRSMKSALHALLIHAGIDPSVKYHETMTQAWIYAVHHFMHQTESADCAKDFIQQNTVLLDSNIMLSHYSAEVLFSDQARRHFLAPDLESIPRDHEDV